MKHVTRIYKTEKGYFKNSIGNYTDLRDFFSKHFMGYSKDGKTEMYKTPSDELKKEIADRIIKRHFERRSKADKERIKNALVNGNCDLSYLQCFTLTAQFF